jgi:crotonobetainyl-CoA:carnitine CoA-transferase CaiB-like acyl-CoA transferase
MSEQPSAAGAPPLDGITVVDIGHIVAGPFVASILGDFGARVIKVEGPDRPDPSRSLYPKDGIGVWAKALDRNKEPITLDLKQPRGVALLEQLLAQADVLVENFRPGVLEDLGLAPERLLAEVNPALIICRVSGWGQTGPWADRRGYGRTGEAGSGFAHLNGEPDGPPSHSAMSLGDTATAIWAAYGTMLALRARDRDGAGQVVDIGLNESLLRMNEHQIVVQDQHDRTLGRLGNASPGVPTVNVYASRDGGWFSVANATVRTQLAFIRIVGLQDDPDLGTLAGITAERERFHAHVERWMAERDLDEIDRLFHEGGAVGTPIWSAKEIIDHPQVLAREMVVTVDDPDLGPLRMLGIVPKLTRTPGAIRATGRASGAANAEIYGDLLGLDADEQARLATDGVI